MHPGTVSNECAGALKQIEEPMDTIVDAWESHPSGPLPLSSARDETTPFPLFMGAQLLCLAALIWFVCG
jgi:hypothetical protein